MKHALYSGSENLYGDMQTAAKSLIANSDVDKVWLLTEGGYDFWLPDMCEIVDASTDDEDERADMKLNMSTKLENPVSAAQLTGLLVDPDYYLVNLRKYDPEIRVEVIDYDDGEGNA